MPIPGQTISLPEYGMGLVVPAEQTPLVYGTSSSGTADTLYTFTTPTACVATAGQGPAVEAACRILKAGGGPICFMRSTSSVAATISAVTKAAVGASTGTITTGGTANDDYQVRVEILTTGTLGTGTFRYTLEYDASAGYVPTWSEELVIPVGATYTMPSTGVTLTFVPGAGAVFFEDGDTHTFSCTAAYYNSADVATSVTALLAALTTSWDWILFAGRPATAAAGATLFSAIATHMGTFATSFRYARALMDSGVDTAANVATAYDAVSNARMAVAFGTVHQPSGKPIPGWAQPALPVSVAAAARASKAKLSEDLGRVRSGALVGCSFPSHDEFLDEALDVHKIITTRTYPKTAGVFLTNGHLKSAAGSDYRYWQHGRIMDVAADTVQTKQQLFIGSEPRTNSDGTIYEADAQAFEGEVEDALRQQLSQPANASGKPGHVSDLNYAIDRTVNLLATETIQSDTAIRPLGYPKYITSTLGYSQAVGEEE